MNYLNNINHRHVYKGCGLLEVKFRSKVSYLE